MVVCECLIDMVIVSHKYGVVIMKPIQPHVVKYGIRLGLSVYYYVLK